MSIMSAKSFEKNPKSLYTLQSLFIILISKLSIYLFMLFESFRREKYFCSILFIFLNHFILYYDIPSLRKIFKSNFKYLSKFKMNSKSTNILFFNPRFNIIIIIIIFLDLLFFSPQPKHPFAATLLPITTKYGQAYIIIIFVVEII
jgi:hypothetical protein